VWADRISTRLSPTPDGSNELVHANRARARFGPPQHFGNRRTFGDTHDFRDEILGQRLTGNFGPALQRPMDILRDVANPQFFAMHPA